MQQSAYGVELTIEQNAEGEVTPTVPVTWNITDDLIAKIAKKGYVNPYMMIVVTSRRSVRSSGYTFDEFNTTQVRLAKLEARREYISFSRPGTNSVFGVIVDLGSRSAVKQFQDLRSVPARLTVLRDATSIEQRGGDSSLGLKKFARIDVTVPAELFAKEPPKWLKAIVENIFPGRPFDECNLRGRALVAVPLAFFVQLYGIFARLATLIVLTGIAGKRPDWREFIAFNPHEFARSFDDGLDDSIWFTKKDGSDRTGFFRWINPPMILLYLFIGGIAAFLVCIVPIVVFLIWGGILGKGHAIPLDAGQYILVSAGIDLVCAVILAAVIMFMMVREGKLYWSDIRGRLMVWTWRNKSAGTVEPYARLAALSAAGPVGDTTIHLLFYRAKARVCRPFAR